MLLPFIAGFPSCIWCIQICTRLHIRLLCSVKDSGEVSPGFTLVLFCCIGYWKFHSVSFIHSLIHSFIHQQWKWSKFLGYSTSDPKNSYCAAQKQAHGSGKFIYWLYTKIGPENTFMLIKSLFLFFIFVALIWSYHGFVHLETTSFSLPLESNGWSLFPIYVMWTSLEGKKNSTRWKDATSAPWKLEE